MMRIELLRRFIVIAEELNLTSAAGKLFVAQPLLSKQLRQLEEEYGCTLISRTTSNMVLTPEGEMLYDRAKTICELDSQLRKDIVGRKRRPIHEVKIGIPPFIALMYFSDKINEFLEKYPYVKLNIIEGGTFNTSQYLKSGLVDVAVSHGAAGSMAEVSSYYRKSVDFILGFSKSAFPQLLEKEYVTAEDIIELPIYVCSRFIPLLHASENSRNIHFNIVCTSNVLHTGAKIVENGFAVGLFPSYTMHHMKTRSELAICPIKDDHLKIELHVLTSSNKTPDKITSDLIENVIEALDEIFSLAQG